MPLWPHAYGYASRVLSLITTDRCRGPPSSLHHVDKRTGDVIRRYEYEKPGAMIHVNVKKLGNIPAGGSWRYVGRDQGNRNRLAALVRAGSRSHPIVGTAHVHMVIDDHSRVTYAEIHADETVATAVAVHRRAVPWFADRGVAVEQVLSDNGSTYKSHLSRDTCTELNIKARKTRPYRPLTKGKIERFRFHLTLADGRAFKRFDAIESACRNTLPAWLHHYNHHRPHSAIGGQPLNQLAWAVQLGANRFI